jgi:long-chain acyl-CoA synthetase
MRDFEEKFGCKVLEGYGLSETSPVATFNHPDKENKPGSIGTPIQGVEMKLVDEEGNDVEGTDEVGEIAIKGHNVMKGYWNREDATDEVMSDDGWFTTGDMGKRDDDGYYFIVDRKKEMIIRGGYNVYPREIEEVLYEHPPSPRPPWSASPTTRWARRSARRSSSRTGRDVSADEARDFVKSRSPTTSTRARSGSPMSSQGPDGQDPQARGRGPRGGQDRLTNRSPGRLRRPGDSSENIL